MPTMMTGQNVQSIASLVEEIEALAEHACLHGPASDCAARVEEVIDKHRARIAAARRVEREALEKTSEVD